MDSVRRDSRRLIRVSRTAPPKNLRSAPTNSGIRQPSSRASVPALLGGPPAPRRSPAPDYPEHYSQSPEVVALAKSISALSPRLMQRRDPRRSAPHVGLPVFGPSLS